MSGLGVGGAMPPTPMVSVAVGQLFEPVQLVQDALALIVDAPDVGAVRVVVSVNGCDGVQGGHYPPR